MSTWQFLRAWWLCLRTEHKHTLLPAYYGKPCRFCGLTIVEES